MRDANDSTVTYQLAVLRWALLCLTGLWMTILPGCATPRADHIDQRSYQLGIIAGFAEVVHLGVKTLALSEPMAPAEMDALYEEAQQIAQRNQVKLWRETALIETDLYPADIARGKHVLLIYQGDTLESYLSLKEDKAALVADGKYTGTARQKIARRFGRLLSYPNAVIDQLLQD